MKTMIELNLQTKSPEQEAIKSYLQENASETLADKINKGEPATVDGKPLINRKNLDGFMKFACEEAKMLSKKDARFACIKSDTVFAWAIHYFEEDSIIGSLYNSDGTEHKPEPKVKPKTVTPAVVKVKMNRRQTAINFLYSIRRKQTKKPMPNLTAQSKVRWLRRTARLSITKTLTATVRKQSKSRLPSNLTK
jgi:hypothetical protein